MAHEAHLKLDPSFFHSPDGFITIAQVLGQGFFAEDMLTRLGGCLDYISMGAGGCGNHDRIHHLAFQQLVVIPKGITNVVLGLDLFQGFLGWIRHRHQLNFRNVLAPSGSRSGKGEGVSIHLPHPARADQSYTNGHTASLVSWRGGRSMSDDLHLRCRQVSNLM